MPHKSNFRMCANGTKISDKACRAERKAPRGRIIITAALFRFDSVRKKFTRERSKANAIFTAQKGQNRPLILRAVLYQSVIGAKTAPISRDSCTGETLICMPVLPALTKNQGRFSADESIIVRNCFFIPTGLHPP